MLNKIHNSGSFVLLVKTSRPFFEIQSEIQEKIRLIDNKIPLYLNVSLDSLVHGTLNNRRAFMLLVTILSAMALVLSAITRTNTVTEMNARGSVGFT